jgi:hypothetical protein
MNKACSAPGKYVELSLPLKWLIYLGCAKIIKIKQRDTIQDYSLSWKLKHINYMHAKYLANTDFSGMQVLLA